MAPIPPQEQLDVIVVPGHKNPQFLQGRINKAISLYLQGRARSLLLCGGAGEAAAMANSAQLAGISSATIELEQKSSTTLENALFSKLIIDQRQWQSAVIVSDGFHLARLWLCFRKSGLKNIELASTPFPKNFPERLQWLLGLLREGIALPYYCIKTLRL